MILSIQDTRIFCVQRHISIFQKLAFNEAWGFANVTTVFLHCYIHLPIGTHTRTRMHTEQLLYLKRHPSHYASHFIVSCVLHAQVSFCFMKLTHARNLIWHCDFFFLFSLPQHCLQLREAVRNDSN